jgi:hypothetical protein
VSGTVRGLYHDLTINFPPAPFQADTLCFAVSVGTGKIKRLAKSIYIFIIMCLKGLLRRMLVFQNLDYHPYQEPLAQQEKQKHNVKSNRHLTQRNIYDHNSSCDRNRI